MERGPAAERVAANVRALREARNRMPLTELSARLAMIGRPILPSGISKIETGDRRVDVDDLVALAIALDTTPNRLLLPAEATTAKVGLTAQLATTAKAAWAWATGDAALPVGPWAPSPRRINLNRTRRFGRENRPHAPRAEMSIEEMDQRTAELRPLVDAFRTARESGIPAEDLIAYLKVVEIGRDLAERAKALREGEGQDGQR